MRSYANAACIALIGAVVICAILYVASNALDMLGAIVAAFILLHFVIHLLSLFCRSIQLTCNNILAKTKHFIHIGETYVIICYRRPSSLDLRLHE